MKRVCGGGGGLLLGNIEEKFKCMTFSSYFNR